MAKQSLIDKAIADMKAKRDALTDAIDALEEAKKQHEGKSAKPRRRKAKKTTDADQST
jgi:hypothetical protein